MLTDPQVGLGDYPPAIQERSGAARDLHPLALLLGLLFVLVLIAGPIVAVVRMQRRSSAAITLTAFVVLMTFNLVDLVVVDWLVFATLTPDFVVLPGTQGMPEYKDYLFHLTGFAIGTVLSGAVAVVVAGACRVIAALQHLRAGSNSVARTTRN